MRIQRVPLAAMGLLAAACQTVQQVKAPAEFIGRTQPSVVLVTYNDNSEVQVAQPRMSGDTLYGTWLGLDESLAIPMGDVQRIDAVQKDAKQTTLLVVGITAATAVVTYGLSRAVFNHGGSCNYDRPIDQRGAYEDKQCFKTSTPTTP